MGVSYSGVRRFGERRSFPLRYNFVTLFFKRLTS